MSYVRALAAAGQWQAATAKMKEAVANDPHNAELQDELASRNAQHKDWHDAEQAFSSALTANPQLAVAHLHLGLARRAEQQTGALDELAKAYELAPENAFITTQYGQRSGRCGPG